MNNWIVITGGPSCGKTTTIKLLKEKGYICTTETAREYIESQLNVGLSLNQIRANPLEFQNHIFKLQCDLEKKLNPEVLTFLDRAIPDSIAYYRFRKNPIPEFVKSVYKKSTHKYKKVFILDALPMIKDHVRIESDEEAEEISKELMRSYSEIGVQIVRVPVLKMHERVTFILRQSEMDSSV